MNLGKLRQALTARELFNLIQEELDQVEKKLTAESVAPLDTVTAIGQYLHSSGGKRLRPALLLLSAKFAGHRSDLGRQRFSWARSWSWSTPRRSCMTT